MPSRFPERSNQVSDERPATAFPGQHRGGRRTGLSLETEVIIAGEQSAKTPVRMEAGHYVLRGSG